MGYTPEHVRFYLIYGHYREKMNFTQKQFQITARLLDEFRELAAKLFDDDLLVPNSKSADIVPDMINEMIPKFEECMNNDLDIKCAFDDLLEIIGKFLQLKQDSQLAKLDIDKIHKNLVKIDQVLQVIF
jgi:cysteinyl-tRNA synthetase